MKVTALAVTFFDSDFCHKKPRQFYMEVPESLYFWSKSGKYFVIMTCDSKVEDINQKGTKAFFHRNLNQRDGKHK